MSRYEVTLKGGAWVYVTVDAADPEDAIEQAQEIAPHEVCAQCSGWGREYDLELSEEWEKESVEEVTGG